MVEKCQGKCGLLQAKLNFGKKNGVTEIFLTDTKIKESISFSLNVWQ